MIIRQREWFNGKFEIFVCSLPCQTFKPSSSSLLIQWNHPSFLKLHSVDGFWVFMLHARNILCCSQYWANYSISFSFSASSADDCRTNGRMESLAALSREIWNFHSIYLHGELLNLQWKYRIFRWLPIRYSWNSPKAHELWYFRHNDVKSWTSSYP